MIIPRRKSGHLKGKTEDKRMEKKKTNWGRYLLLTLFYLTLAVFIVTMGTVVYVWLDRKMSGAEGSKDKNGQVEAVSGKTVTENIYTKEQVDELLENLENEKFQELLQARTEGRNSVLNELQAGLEQSSTAIETIRLLYPNHIVIASDGRYYFVPVNDSLEKNNYLQEQLEILEDGEFRYLENGEVISHKGIDVSSHQGVIDWKSVAADGVEFAIIRSAYRGYGSGALVEDTYFETNVKGALAAGIHVGLYIFSQAINEEEMKEEAQLIMSQARKMGVTGPLVLDVEKVSDPMGRMNLITPQERTALVKLYCETVEKEGFYPMIYHNTNMGAIMIDVSELEGYDKWFASYSEKLYYPYQYLIWQYSSTGSVSGIKGNVDVNISFTKFWE